MQARFGYGINRRLRRGKGKKSKQAFRITSPGPLNIKRIGASRDAPDRIEKQR